MNIDQAKKIDSLLGPLCFLLSGLNYIQKISRSKEKKTKPVHKILFIKLSELGAIILAYPLLNRVKKEHPSSDLFFVTFNRNRGIFKILNEIIPEDDILHIRESPGFFILDVVRAIRRLRREKIEIVFDLEFFSKFSAIFSYLVGAEKRVGFYRYTLEGLYRGNLLTHKMQYNPLDHVSRSYLSFSQVIKQWKKNTPQLEENINDSDLIFPKYTPDAATKKGLMDKLRNAGIDAEKNKIFLIHPGDGIMPVREWPIDNFVILCRRILENQENYIIMIGTGDADKKARQILMAINQTNCINLVNKTNIDELLCLFNIADSLISNDCGVVHLAMLSPVKKFIIFGPENPRIFGPLGENNWIIYSDWPCSPCLSVLNNRVSDCRDNRCLKAITPEEVYHAIKNS